LQTVTEQRAKHLLFESNAIEKEKDEKKFQSYTTSNIFVEYGVLDIELYRTEQYSEGALVRKLVELLLELKLFIEHFKKVPLSNRKIYNMV